MPPVMRQTVAGNVAHAQVAAGKWKKRRTHALFHTARTAGIMQGVMTRQLYLLRHLKSSWDDPDLADHDRPLAPRGRKAGILLQEFLRTQAIRPDLVMVSSARRARETLDALQPWETPPQVEIGSALYHASPETILDLIRAAPKAARVLLVIGHNPGLQDFAVLLCADRGGALARRMAESFPTGALAQFDLDRPWAHLEMGGGKVTGFVTPKALKG
jgi:phosphohistidine phosphatase